MPSPGSAGPAARSRTPTCSSRPTRTSSPTASERTATHQRSSRSWAAPPAGRSRWCSRRTWCRSAAGCSPPATARSRLAWARRSCPPAWPTPTGTSRSSTWSAPTGTLVSRAPGRRRERWPPPTGRRSRRPPTPAPAGCSPPPPSTTWSRAPPARRCSAPTWRSACRRPPGSSWCRRDHEHPARDRRPRAGGHRRQRLQRRGGRLRHQAVRRAGPRAGDGAAGDEAVLAGVRRAAAELGCEPEQVLACSTGVIGVPLEIAKLTDGIAKAARDLGPGGGPAAAEAIRTTDTVSKQAGVVADGVTIGGMAKGAAMLAPALAPTGLPHATMIAVLTTDAVAEPRVLRGVLAEACEASFNRVTVDGSQSTNDTVLLLASGSSGVRPHADDLGEAVRAVCYDLAGQMLADAEGGTKVFSVQVGGGGT